MKLGFINCTRKIIKMKNLSIQERRLAVLKDTIEHYNSKNRNFRSSGTGFEMCRYAPLDKTSKGCAIGRLVPLKLAKKLDLINVDYGVVVNDNRVFSLLPDDLKVLGRAFLQNLQLLHDDASNWNNKRLSTYGEMAVDNLLNRCMES